MIVALPAMETLREIRKIVNRHGFLTYPQFLDNKFIEKKGNPDIKWLERELRRYGCGLIHFAVAPDLCYAEMRKFKNQYPDINWIFPLHSVKEDFSDFEWVGMPYEKTRRDYDLQTFLKLTEGKKRWFLGVREGISPRVLYYFNGFDTTIPFLTLNHGEIWQDWNKHQTISNLYPGLSTFEILELNIINFKLFLSKLFAEKPSFINLQSFMVKEIELIEKTEEIQFNFVEEQEEIKFDFE
jgi:hypothetical protein